ncbi:MAG: hypothetical protein LBG80_20425 [Bacteroidales bacterium]|jgi:hypothetical protein|nr:hypothetical protein [Bacteroidales bacterium]
MRKIKRSIAKKIHSIEEGIKGASSSQEIIDILMAHGYPPDEIRKAEILLENVKHLTSTQVEDYGDKYAANELVNKQWDISYSTYMIILKIVRVVFKDELDMLKRFKATGKRRQSLSGWLNDANIFYSNILDTPAAIERLQRYGYTYERLQKEYDGVKEVEALHSRKLAEKGEAQQSTVERDKAFDELCNWYSDFRAIARIAFYEKPQLLEALGIKIKN